MKLEEIISKFIEKPFYLDMGAGKLSKRWKTTKEDVYEARKIARAHIKENNKKNKLPKILIFDIETTPLEAYIWQKEVWKARVGHTNVISQWFILTWSAKWLFSNEVLSEKLTKSEVLNEDDGRIVKELWKLFDEADIIVAHNGDGFDVPNMNTRFLVNGLVPPSPYQRIDTLKIAKKEFGFTHNALDALAKVLGLKGKINTDFDLWRRCKRGDEEALEYMELYNRQDVLLLEEVYLELRPWIKSHPSIALFLESEKMVCPSCGHDHLKKKGEYRTQVSVFDTYQCKKCGAISRSRVNKVTKDVKKNLLVSVPR